MIEIPVTQDDIDKGVLDYIKPDGCVIARALRRHFGDAVLILVGSTDVILRKDRDVVCQFDASLQQFANTVRDAFHEIERLPSPGIIRLDEQAMTAGYEETPG